jgi:hypothetical protein
MASNPVSMLPYTVLAQGNRSWIYEDALFRNVGRAPAISLSCIGALIRFRRRFGYAA